MRPRHSPSALPSGLLRWLFWLPTHDLTILRLPSFCATSPILFRSAKPGYVIKLPDGDQLPRSLVQYDLLHAIFSSPLRVFTPPRTSSELIIPPSMLNKEGETEEEKGKLTFGELYVVSQACSPRGTKSMRDKMLADLEYAVDFAKVRDTLSGLRPEAMACDWNLTLSLLSRSISLQLSLLINVGKMNTTFAFYPVSIHPHFHVQTALLFPFSLISAAFISFPSSVGNANHPPNIPRSPLSSTQFELA